MKIIGSVTETTAEHGDVIAEHLGKQQPLIVRGASAKSIAVKKWKNREYLLDKIGTMKVQYKKSHSTYFPDPKTLSNPENFSILESSLYDYMQLIAGSETTGMNYFLSGNELSIYRNGKYNSAMQEINNDLEIPHCIQIDRLAEVGFWLTSKGISSCLHYDRNGCGNINVQVTGQKKFLMISPEQYEKLYMYESTKPNPFFNFSRVIPEELDVDVYPKFADVHGETGELFPGDWLYIPPLWIHKFDHVGEFNANITYWWQQDNIPLNNTSLTWALGTAIMKLAWDKSKNLSSQEFDFAELDKGMNSLGDGKVAFKNLENIFREWGAAVSY